MNFEENKEYLGEFRRRKWKESCVIIVSRKKIISRLFFFSVACTVATYTYHWSHSYRYTGHWATTSLAYRTPLTQQIICDIKPSLVKSGHCVKNLSLKFLGIHFESLEGKQNNKRDRVSNKYNRREHTSRLKLTNCFFCFKWFYFPWKLLHKMTYHNPYF